jgi:hypothetical protein
MPVSLDKRLTACLDEVAKETTALYLHPPMSAKFDGQLIKKRGKHTVQTTN